MHDNEEMDKETGKPAIIADYNANKSGVDIVDKMSATYSVSRMTRRWPMVIFFSLLNIAGINAQVILQMVRPENAPRLRRIFLHNLGLSLMQTHLLSRALITSLPSDITSFLRKRYSLAMENEGKTSREPERKKKKGTCIECGRKKNSNTTVTCCKCGNFTCKNHSNVICNNCFSCNSEDSM